MSDFGCRNGVNAQAGSSLGLAAVDELVSITMVGRCVTIRSCAPLDGLRTCVLVDAVNAAIDEGSVVSVGCHDVERVSPPIEPAVSDREVHHLQAVAAGVAVVRCDGPTWMIDFTGQRFVRSDRQLDHHFVPAEAWGPFVGLWMSADAISVLLPTGSYVTACRSSGRPPTVGVHSTGDRIAS